MKENNCIRTEPWHICVRVIKQEGHCAMGHTVGDKVTIKFDEIDGRICIHALYSMMPKIVAMMHNAVFPWLDDQCRATHACPDGYNPVMFELERIES